MSVSAEEKDVVERMFEAMQTGLEAEDDMMALFADDAVFTEPFSGEARTHEGSAAIRKCFVDMWSYSGPDVELSVDRVYSDGGGIAADWTCDSTAFAKPMRGVDRFRIENGSIRYLEIIVTDMPPMDGEGSGGN